MRSCSSLLFPVLVFVLLLVALPFVVPTGPPSPNATLLCNVRSLPCLSKLSSFLNLSINAPIRSLLSTCTSDNSTVTLFAPTDCAVAKAHQRIDALLRRSGYPPLADVKRNITAAFNDSNNEEAVDVNESFTEDAVDFQLAQVEGDLERMAVAPGDGCSPWWNRTREGGGGGGGGPMASFANSPDVIPPGLNITDVTRISTLSVLCIEQLSRTAAHLRLLSCVPVCR